MTKCYDYEEMLSELNDPHTWLIHGDADLLVINKPAGLLSLPDGYNAALPHLKQLLEPVFGPLWMVHRLDKDTSGVMVLARSAESHRLLNAQFKQRQIGKVYHCLVEPCPEWEALEMAEPLRSNADRSHHTRVDFSRGKPALTLAQVLTREPDWALLACDIHTGYTHQIRAHLYYHGLHVLGDTFYLPKTIRTNGSLPLAARMLLHALTLTLRHPATDEALTFTAPYPPDFQDYLGLVQTHKSG